jgi:cation diffusion facilitator family transporter
LNRLQKTAFGSLAVALIVLAAKYAAYLLTGSVALYSDALESVINVATALAAIFAIWIAAFPPDAEHPYGHQKAEYLTAAGVGGLIIFAALAILRESYLGFMAPRPIETSWAGLAASAAATLLNAVWSAALIRIGRRNRSAALVADGKHLLSDVVTSIGVLVGVVLVFMTRIDVLDSIIAALVALHVLWNGWGVIRENASGLIDEAAPAAELALIRKTIASNAGGAIEAHALRTRHAGKATFIEFHLIVPGAMSVADAHAICDDIEQALKNELPDAVISIHVEPDTEAEHKGIVVL